MTEPQDAEPGGPGVYAYEREPYRRRLETEVALSGEEEGRYWCLPLDTLLFPGGGGQPADHGRLNGIAVGGLRRTDEGLRHLTATPVAPGPAVLELDWRRRFDHMQQHTAQHLLSALALERFGWRTTAFHLGAEVSDIELDVPAIPEERLASLEEETAAVVRQARPVRTRRVSPEEYGRMVVRSRGLPAGHRGDVRLVEIEGIDLNTCGGTHVASTAELESVKLLATASMRGGTRLHWVAGCRARRLLGRHLARAAAIRSLLDCADDEVEAVVGAKLEQLQAAGRQRRHLARKLADEVAGRLAAAPGALVEEHVEGADPGLLQHVARVLRERAPQKTAFLTAEESAGCAFVLVVGEAAAVDAGELGRRVAGLLGGRGGGPPGLFQGKAETLAKRAEALETVRRAVGG